MGARVDESPTSIPLPPRSCSSTRCACRSFHSCRLRTMRLTERLASGRLLALIAIIPLAAMLACHEVNTRNVRVVVPRGSNLRVAAESLANAQIIRYPTLFRLYGMLRRRDRSIRAGTYVFQPRMSWVEVLDVRNGGKGVEPSSTIPEEWSLAPLEP